MPYRNILTEEAGGVFAITVNRPEKLNALNAETIGELDAALDEAAAGEEIRGVLLTGAGDRAFIAGADINELARVTSQEAQALAERGQRLTRRLERLGKLSVAAVNGFALGGGLELAMACTVRFASTNAKLGQPEVKLGLPPGYGGTQRLPRLVGRGRALEMLLSGDPIDAKRALEIGLVNGVYEPGELLARTREWMSKVLANSPVASRLVLEAVDVGLNSGLEEGLRYEAAAFGLACAAADRAEGTRAFLEKRKPAFSGR
jgi:enoyl-CoA hydratase